jgi:hypothetical protein
MLTPRELAGRRRENLDGERVRKTGKSLLRIAVLALTVLPSVLFAAETYVPPEDRYVVTPLVDQPLRDPSVCRGPDGVYYLTGTTPVIGKDGEPDWSNGTKTHLWRSSDLKNWEQIVVRTFDEEKDVPKSRREYTSERPADWCKYYMDCEIHYLPGKKTFFIYYKAYGNDKAGPGFQGILKSVTGKGEGPYEKTQDRGCQSGLFEDDDGSLYEYCGCNGLTRLNDDLSLDRRLPGVTRARAGACFEDSGVCMVKMFGK